MPQRFERTDSGVVLVTREMLQAASCLTPAADARPAGQRRNLSRCSRPADWPTSPARCRWRWRQPAQDVRVLLPGFPAILRRRRATRRRWPTSPRPGASARGCARAASPLPAAPASPAYVIDAPALYDRPGNPYEDAAAPALRRQPPPLRAARLGRGAAGAGARRRLAAARWCMRTTGMPAWRRPTWPSRAPTRAAARRQRLHRAQPGLPGRVRALALRRPRPAGRGLRRRTGSSSTARCRS